MDRAVLGIERDDVLLMVDRILMRIAGMEAVDPAYADLTYTEALQRMTARRGRGGARSQASGSAGFSVELQARSNDVDLADVIMEMLADAERPMSMEQIYDAISAMSAAEVRRETLAVRLHRMANAAPPKIVNTSRGHYWALEGNRRGGGGRS